MRLHRPFASSINEIARQRRPPQSGTRIITLTRRHRSCRFHRRSILRKFFNRVGVQTLANQVCQLQRTSKGHPSCFADHPTRVSNAMEKVFDTPELMEMILLRLSNKTFIGAKRTCQIFAITYDTSIKIQRKLFMRDAPWPGYESRQDVYLQYCSGPFHSIRKKKQRIFVSTWTPPDRCTAALFKLLNLHFLRSIPMIPTFCFDLNSISILAHPESLSKTHSTQSSLHPLPPQLQRQPLNTNTACSPYEISRRLPRIEPALYW